MLSPPRRIIMASGKPAIEFAAECAEADIPRLAEKIAARLGMTITQHIKGADVLMWLATLGDQQWCISWDIWVCDLIVMPWDDPPATPTASDSAIDGLLERWSSAP